ncbi:prophage regulatory protein [Nitrosospira briensis]|uniref:Prophage regulatory protein n=1 Tax=Nitrosospira briensis TaxID=35799 RepID=A0A1I5B4P8_9PROT|nr:AlpA family phage regulatory protein [Nitrosospira briensis]SFN69580.1 prophage regulatory protein [Nitrosospira briensis]
MKLIKLPPVLGLTAKSRTSHYSDIKNGLMTEPVRLGENSVAWPEHEILAINAARIAGKSNSEVRELVSQLMARRKDVTSFTSRACSLDQVAQ